MLRRCKSFIATTVLALMLGLSATSLVTASSSLIVSASSIEDKVGDDKTDTGGILGGELSKDDQDVADILKGHRGMTGENLATAEKTLGPVMNMFGNMVGGIVVFVFGGVFVITAFDLLYITIPPLRNVLYKGQGGGAPMGGAPMGGMGMGRMGMMGSSMNQGMAAESRPLQLISDEAVQCVALLNNGGAQPQMGGMGAMGAMQNPGQNMSMKSVIGVYFKKRMFFMILLAICAIVLTSSLLLDTGINLAQWILKLFSALNGNIPG